MNDVIKWTFGSGSFNCKMKLSKTAPYKKGTEPHSLIMQEERRDIQEISLLCRYHWKEGI